MEGECMEVIKEKNGVIDEDTKNTIILDRKKTQHFKIISRSA
jgi:hypothetical protein